MGDGKIGGNRSVGAIFVACCCWENEKGADGGWIVLKDGIDDEELGGTPLGAICDDDDDGLSVISPKYLQWNINKC
jgi:hypothetical protein